MGQRGRSGERLCRRSTQKMAGILEVSSTAEAASPPCVEREASERGSRCDFRTWGCGRRDTCRQEADNTGPSRGCERGSRTQHGPGPHHELCTTQRHGLWPWVPHCGTSASCSVARRRLFPLRVARLGAARGSLRGHRGVRRRRRVHSDSLVNDAKVSLDWTHDERFAVAATLGFARDAAALHLETSRDADVYPEVALWKNGSAHGQVTLAPMWMLICSFCVDRA